MEEVIYTAPAETTAETAPKFCIARAVVSMVMGIEGICLAPFALAFSCIPGFVKFFISMLGETLPMEANLIIGIMMTVYVFIFAIVAIILGVVALIEANKFNRFYHRESKMAKAGKVMGILTIVISVIAMVVSLVGAIV